MIRFGVQLVHADQFLDPEILAYRSPGRYGSERPEQGRKAKIKRGQVGSLGEVASLSHPMPLLLTKLKSLLYDNPLGSWETRKRKEKRKEEREGEEKESNLCLPLCCREEPQERLSVLHLFKVIS